MKNIENTNKNQLNKVLDPKNFTKAELIGTVESMRAKVEDYNKLEKKYDKVVIRLQQLEEMLTLMQKKKFARSKDIDPNQITMGDISADFNKVEVDDSIAEPVIVEKTIKTNIAGRKKHAGANKSCFDGLPEIIEEIRIDDELCPDCGNDLKFIRYDDRVEICMYPPKLYKKIIKTAIYSCTECEADGINPIKSAKTTLPVIKGGFAGASLISWIMSEKYCQKVPVYRIEQKFKSLGVDISRATMNNWLLTASDMYLVPVHNTMKAHLLKSSVIHADETPFNVNSIKGKPYIWTYSTGKYEEKQIVLYDYSPTRKGQYAVDFLAEYNGFLQTDEYGGYNFLDKVTRLGCMAHGRRKFTDAACVIKKYRTSEADFTSKTITKIDDIFRIDRELKDLTPEERYEKRLELIEPKLKALKSHLELNKVLFTNGKTGIAINYMLKHWDHLTGFLKDGRLESTNNRAERFVKPVVIGRKNYLFCESEKGAESLATIFSLVETAKANNLIPQKYLEYLLEELSQTKHTPEKLEEVMPWSDRIPEEIKVKITQSS